MATARHPALSARVWPVLAAGEWFKARKRPASYITFGFFAFVTLMDHGESLFRSRRDADYTYALPEAWSSVFSGDSVLMLFFGCIALVMLVSSEFAWRTARQNVIDGLSKSQWFWGKAMLLPMVGLVFLATKLGIGGGSAVLAGGFTDLSGPAFPPSVLAASGGLLLAFLTVGSLAFLFSTWIRSSGPAMAAWFFWVAMGEQIVPQLLGRPFPALRTALGYLPFNSAQKLLEFWVWDASAYQRIVAQAASAEGTPPPPPDLALDVAVNVGWVVVLLGVAYWLYSRRDL